jgi:pimeloyl-ACP methyl ester carboxylesterase
VGQVELNVVRLGQVKDRPVLMLHGWGRSLESLLPLADLLADAADVHLIDLPGFGGSGAPDGVWGTKEYAETIKHYLDDQDLSHVTLLGHSFGGKVSIRFASKYPERVEGLILVDSSGLKPIRSFRKKMRFLMVSVLRRVARLIDKYAGLEVYRNWFIPRFASADYLNAGPLKETFVRVVNEDLAASVAKISAPTLLIWGEDDTETPLEMAHRLKGLLRVASLVVLPGKGHYPFEGSGAHLCAHYIGSFLKGTAAPDMEKEKTHA